MNSYGTSLKRNEIVELHRVILTGTAKQVYKELSKPERWKYLLNSRPAAKEIGFSEASS